MCTNAQTVTELVLKLTMRSARSLHPAAAFEGLPPSGAFGRRLGGLFGILYQWCIAASEGKFRL